MASDTRGLSERLRDRCGPGKGMTYEQASLEMGQPKNAVSLWVNRERVPRPDKYQAIADFLGISKFEVGGAISIDAELRYRSKLTQ